MRICETKQGTMENGLFEWLCLTQKNSTAVGGQTMAVNAVKTALILKASEMYGGSGSKADRTLRGNQ
jgi:hypothetical protein